MRTAGKYPHRIVTSGIDATTIMQGSKRAWSYDEAGGLTDDMAEIVAGSGGAGTSFTRWITNRGQGTHVAAFRAGNGDVDYGGVTWHSFFGQVRTVNGISCHFSYPGQSWGAQAGGMLPAIPAFDTLLYSGGAAAGGFITQLYGLVPGRSYVVQIIVADSRAGAGVGPRTLRLAPIDGLPAIHAPQLEPRYAYEGETKYLVYSLRFIAPANGTITFRPDTYNGATYTEVHINAINVIQDVLPQGKFFYVANDGNDNNDGMSRDTPWASISRVHERTYGPGDCILFKRGHKWTGRLTPAGNGAVGKPIILGAYGDGAHPLIDGAGYAHTPPSTTGVIQLGNQSHWIIDGFEVMNWKAGENFYAGIFASGDGNTRGLTIRNCHVHDIKGGYKAADPSVPGRWTGGIHVWSHGGQVGNYDDVLIENNTVEHVLGIGIQIWGPVESGGSMAGAWPNLCENNVIRGNTVWGCSSDNILYQGCKDALVEFNHSGFSGLHGRFPSAIAGIWGSRSDGGVQQYNHSHNSMTWGGASESYDAQGLGIDIWMRGTTTLRYNFTHDNFGGFALDYHDGNEGGAVLLCHHNISLNEARFTSGRDERHYHGIYHAPADDFLLHWGYTNLTVRNCVFTVGTMASGINSAALVSNNLWWTLPAKPSADTAGVRANPEFNAPPPGLIYRDEYVSYNAGEPNTPMAAGQIEPRKLGALKAATYNTFGESAQFWVGRVRALELTNPGGSSALALNANLASGVAGPLTVQVLVRSVSASDPTNWLAFIFRDASYSAEPFVNDSANKFGVLIRRNGECQAFKGNSGQTQPLNWPNQRGVSEFHVVEFVFTDSAGTGSAFAGQGTRLRMFSDGLLLGTYDLGQMSQLHFAYNVYGSEWWVRKLHVFARNGGMDSYDDYAGLIPSATSPLLNTATPNLVPGATDFFRNALDGTPNRGAVEVTTLAGYVQTPTRIEIRGRYRIAKPASGSRNHNYDAIVRDQNFRVIPQQPAWEILPAMTGVTIDANGVVSVAATASTGRFAIKASAGNVTRSFPCEII
jgi:hypothetical protein